jgi:LPXTG-motif cell wall-anchored protein
VRIAVTRTVVATASIAAFAVAGLVALPTAASAATTGDIKITEWEYNGSEFVEFTNLDTVAIDLTGWSFSDSAEHAGDVPFGPLGTVVPGESFLLSEASAVDFRAEWGLPDSVKVLGDNGQNLGRDDAINLYDPDGTLVDSLVYNDQGTGDVAGPRTDTASAWPSSSGVLGANTASAWTRSTVGDAEASWTSTDGKYVGSPGLSRFGTGVRWVRINEVSSAGSDPVELVNLAPVAVDVSGWTQTDSGHTPGPLAGLSASTVPAHGYVTFTSNQGLSGDGDAVRLYLADGTTLLDSATFGADEAEPGSWSRCPDGTGADFVHAATATFGAANDCSGDSGDGGDGGTPPSDPENFKDIVINEVSSDNDGLGFAPLPDLSDGIELYNKGTDSVDLTGWKQIDSGSAASASDFSGALYVDGVQSTVIPAGHYGVFPSTKGLGSGGDAVKVYTAAGTLVDELDYLAGQAGVDETVNTDHKYRALAACPDGSDTFLEVTTASFGASNATACETGVPPLTGGSGPEAPCDTEDSGTDPGTVPTTALTWPGGDTPVTIDAQCAWVTSESGQDLSGLVFDPNDANVLYAVKNKSHVWRLLNSGGTWVNDTANGWTDGKDIRFPGGGGLPDSEGLAVGADGSLYITTERDNAASGVPLDTILRFDPTTSDATLVATDEWNLTSDLGFSPADANLGFEGVAYVPDSFLVSQGFRTDDGALYDPADYPDKAAPGLFFAAVEKTGHLLAYVLNDDADHTWTRVADVASGMAGVMDDSFDPDLGRIWAHCDNTCGNATALLKIGADGRFTVDKYYARPANLPNYNLEGFAVAPVSTAVGGQRQVLWSDDGNRFGHSLWAGTISAELPLSVVITPSTTTPAPGDRITLTATGFTPGTEYEAVLHSAPVLLGTGTAGPSGTLSLSATIPASTPAGAHTITIAATSDPSTILASIGITVVGTLASTGVSPEPGLIGAGILLLLGAGLLVTRRLRRRSAGADTP